MRDPANVPPPEGIEDRRLQIYRGLLFNNVQKFMANSFPVLRKLYSDKAWRRLIRDYYRRHQAHTPLFPRMPQEFLSYLQNERGVAEGDPPFLLELAEYEWLEVSLGIDTREIDETGIDAEGDLLAGVPVSNPLIYPMAFRFPVHRIGPDYQPDEPAEQRSYLVIYRDRRDRVGFMELNPVSARLLELIINNHTASGELLVMQIAEELRHPNPDAVRVGGQQTLAEFRKVDILLGTTA
jgi:hypothetical protein